MGGGLLWGCFSLLPERFSFASWRRLLKFLVPEVAHVSLFSLCSCEISVNLLNTLDDLNYSTLVRFILLIMGDRVMMC